jgi:hypothetical protein
MTATHICLVWCRGNYQHTVLRTQNTTKGDSTRLKTRVMTISYKVFNIRKLNRKYMQDVAHTGNAPNVIGKEMVYTVNIINSTYDPQNYIKAVNFFVCMLQYCTKIPIYFVSL